MPNSRGRFGRIRLFSRVTVAQHHVAHLTLEDCCRKLSNEGLKTAGAQKLQRFADATSPIKFKARGRSDRSKSQLRTPALQLAVTSI